MKIQYALVMKEEKNQSTYVDTDRVSHVDPYDSATLFSRCQEDEWKVMNRGCYPKQRRIWKDSAHLVCFPPGDFLSLFSFYFRYEGSN